MSKGVPKAKQPIPPLFNTVEELDHWYKKQRGYMLGLPIPKHYNTRQQPWGYKYSETDENFFEPVESEIKLLVEAKLAMQWATYPDIADYLSTESGRSITGWGVQKIMQTRQPDERAALPREEREKI